MTLALNRVLAHALPLLAATTARGESETVNFKNADVSFWVARLM
jgi:hypothetical protein